NCTRPDLKEKRFEVDGERMWKLVKCECSCRAVSAALVFAGVGARCNCLSYKIARLLFWKTRYRDSAPPGITSIIGITSVGSARRATRSPTLKDGSCFRAFGMHSMYR